MTATFVLELPRRLVELNPRLELGSNLFKCRQVQDPHIGCEGLAGL
jgi:hypothetical protein